MGGKTGTAPKRNKVVAKGTSSTIHVAFMQASKATVTYNGEN
jgi:hypothetical protein